ncbi:MAG: ComEC/Rec2 family competence protein [Candidatus Saccharimonas sp.]
MKYWLKERIHPTWQLTAGAAGIVTGVALAQYLPQFSHIAWLGLGLALAAMAVALPRRILLLLAFVAGGMIGLWRGGTEQWVLQRYAPLYGQHVLLSGTVADDTETNKRGETVLRLQGVTLEDKRLPGEIWVALAQKNVQIQRSDRVNIDGKLLPGFGSFAASLPQAKLVSQQREQPGDIALSVRDWFAAKVGSVIHEPAASLGIGFLLGQKRGLPDELQDALKIAGLTHIVVASGYNLTILVRLGRRLFARVSKYLAAVVSLGLVGAFIAITGLSPSMTRAGLVATLCIWAWYYGRRFHPVTLLLLVACVTVLSNPSYAWGNLGWQLSFAAFAGVMILAPLLTAYFFGKQKPPMVGQILLETLSAQIVTMPILLATFGVTSVVAVLSNLLILPFIPFVMLATFVAGLAAVVSSGFGYIVALPAQYMLDAMLAVIHWTSEIEWAQLQVALPSWGVWVWYILLALACYYMYRVTKFSLRSTSVVE